MSGCGQGSTHRSHKWWALWVCYQLILEGSSCLLLASWAPSVNRKAFCWHRPFWNKLNHNLKKTPCGDVYSTNTTIFSHTWFVWSIIPNHSKIQVFLPIKTHYFMIYIRIDIHVLLFETQPCSRCGDWQTGIKDLMGRHNRWVSLFRCIDLWELIGRRLK